MIITKELIDNIKELRREVRLELREKEEEVQECINELAYTIVECIEDNNIDIVEGVDIEEICTFLLKYVIKKTTTHKQLVIEKVITLLY